ncbi:uncharacterized protein TNCV_3499961 [Trichonephila clavipes]|nr:uncharacterized protein TNCV_3499961 [Trichonephila clavipes]
MVTPTLMSNEAAIYLILAEVAVHWHAVVCTLTKGSLSRWYWTRTRDKAGRDPIPIPLCYRGHATIHGELRVYIPQSLRGEIMRKFHDKPIAGHLGKKKTFLKKAYFLFSKTCDVSDGSEFVVGNIEKLFKEARQNTRIKHDKWVKYYNKRRREVNIRVNGLVLVETHPISSATKKVVTKFKPKFEGSYRVLSVRNNNVVIWKVLGALGVVSLVRERQVEQREKTSLAGKEQQVNKRKRSRRKSSTSPGRPVRSRREPFSTPSHYFFNHPRQSGQQGHQEPEESLRRRRSSPNLSRQRRQSRQQGHQQPKESQRSRRSTSLEVHIGDIKESR